ncbi:ATP/GTP-binding protein [Flavobacterium sp.]|uniref:AAA family ATPase n=1 Tax=Flavobacterium sp. TaxID=239 RepID=UPI0037536591
MENNHLTYFKIENFKKFDSLEVSDIGQINLIVGDNNVGKTCLLEALLFDEDIDKCIENLHYTLCKRSIHIHPEDVRLKKPKLPESNYFDYLKNNTKSEGIAINWNNNKLFLQDVSINDLTDLDFEKEKKHNYEIGRPNLWIKIYKEDVFEELQFMYLDDFKVKFHHDYLPLIRKDAGFNNDIVKYFKELNFDELTRFKKTFLLFFDDFQDIVFKDYFGRELLAIKLERNNDFLPITYFGDGFNEFIRYILEIPKNKNKRLMIDEIANGVHYSKLKDFWVNIIHLSKELNVQLFATTHSKECIEAYISASNEINYNNEIRLIELKEYNSKIYSNTLKYDSIITSLDSEVELRGGNIFKND